jgi:hypothetical protein
VKIHFFAHLTVANVISAQSMISLLLSFTAVLDEFGVSHGREKRAALCATEGLMIVRSFFISLLLVTKVKYVLGWSSFEAKFRGKRDGNYQRHSCLY